MRRSSFVTGRLRLVAVALLATALGPVTAFAQTPAPAAQIGSEIITREELEAVLSAQLNDLARQRHRVMLRKLDELIYDRLVRQEATRQGVSVNALMTKAMEGAKVTDAEVTDYIDKNREAIQKYFGEKKNLSDAEIKDRVREQLQSQKENDVRERFLDQLRNGTPVTVFLKAPELLRVRTSADKGIVRGAPDAKVTIVEFTDYQCPHCKQATGTLRQLLADYKDVVKVVFRDYPGVPEARKTHEAARCAGAQGKFWEYHDLLFERAPKHEIDDLKGYANELKLDATAFGQCLDSDRHRTDVNTDLAEGRKLGINGTPTFYINGLQLIGAHPIATFKRIIEEELARK